MSRWLIVVLAVAFAASPLASDGFAGFEPSQFPVVQDRWPVQPAGWAFSIWGVIYAWLIGGAAWAAWRGMGWGAALAPLAVSLGVGVFWIAAANAAPVLATVMIAVMAAAAIAALIRGRDLHPLAQTAPLGLYAGWLTAATGVAVAVIASGYGVLPAITAALVAIPVVLGVAVLVTRARPGVWTYPLAVAWALAGVIAANWPDRLWAIIALAAIGIAVLFLTRVTAKEVPA